MRIVVNAEPHILAKDIIAAGTLDGQVLDLIEQLDFEVGDDDFTLVIIKRLLTNVQANVKPDELMETLTKFVREIEEEHYVNGR